MSGNLATISYIGATILFILCLGGLSNQETARRGNLYGMIGMGIAVVATVFGPQVTSVGLPWIIAAMVVGAGIGLYAARVVQMTQMPELVALMHSMVGLAAMLVGYATFIDPAASAGMEGAEKAIHEMEMYIGILIGAVTFSGSVIAFGKLSGKIGGKPLLLPARHWLNLAGLLKLANRLTVLEKYFLCRLPSLPAGLRDQVAGCGLVGSCHIHAKHRMPVVL